MKGSRWRAGRPLLAILSASTLVFVAIVLAAAGCGRAAFPDESIPG